MLMPREPWVKEVPTDPERRDREVCMLYMDEREGGPEAYATAGGTSMAGGGFTPMTPPRPPCMWELDGAG